MNKTPLVSVTALLLLAAIVAGVILLNPRRGSAVMLPEKVTILLEKEGRIVTLNYSELIEGCVFAVTNPKYEKEALKSAACAASTTALYLMNSRSGFSYSGADLSDRALPYLPPEAVEAEYGAKTEKYQSRVREAVSEGINQAITYEGAPICAACCAISAGITDNSDEVLSSGKPYLRSVSALFDKAAKGYESTSRLTSEMVRKALKSAAPDAVLSGYPEEWFSEPRYAESGTLLSVDYGGVRLTGAQLRRLLELRSAAVTIDFTDDCFCFSCKGYGENLGMSLYGANCLALQGKSMEEILLYFYTGCELIPARK